MDPVRWHTVEGYAKDPLRHRDLTINDLVSNDDDDDDDGVVKPAALEHPPERIWWLPPSSSGEKDPDPLRRRDSPPHDLPDDGVFESGAPEPRIKDSHAWFVEFCASSSPVHLVADIYNLDRKRLSMPMLDGNGPITTPDNPAALYT